MVLTFEGLPLGATTAQAAGFDHLSTPAGGGATVIDDAYRGERALRLATGTSGGAGYGELAASLGVQSSGTLHVRLRWRLPEMPPDATGVRPLVIADGNGGFIAELRVTNAGAIQLRDRNAAILYTSDVTYSAGQWIDAGVAVLEFSDTAGQLAFALFDGPDSTSESFTSTADLDTLRDGGTTKVQVGALRGSGLLAFAVDVDDVDVDVDGDWPEIPIAPTVRYGPWSGAVTPGGFAAVWELAGTSEARLVASTEEDLSDPVMGPPGEPDADGLVKLSVSGLAADTLYYYGVEADGRLLPAGRGECRTFPPEGSQASFSIWFGSCQYNVPTGTTYPALLTRTGPYGRALLGVHMGDLHYRDWPAGTTAQEVLDQYRTTLGAAVMAPTLAVIPMTYAWDNHDWGGNTSDRHAPAGPVVAAMYRRVWPHYPLPASNGIGCWQAWTIGRVRFIQIDTRSARDPQSDPPSPSKTMLGAEQKAWLQGELLRPEPVKIICGNMYWRYDSPTGGRWGSYGDEFDALNNWIAAHKARIGGLYVIFGDRHALCADDGSSPSTYGVPQAGGAPIQQGATPRPQSELWSHGYYDTAPNTMHAYGWLDITDDGSTITIEYKGITSDDDTVRVEMTTVFAAGVGELVPGLPVA